MSDPIKVVTDSYGNRSITLDNFRITQPQGQNYFDIRIRDGLEVRVGGPNNREWEESRALLQELRTIFAQGETTATHMGDLSRRIQQLAPLISPRQSFGDHGQPQLSPAAQVEALAAARQAFGEIDLTFNADHHQSASSSVNATSGSPKSFQNRRRLTLGMPTQVWHTSAPQLSEEQKEEGLKALPWNQGRFNNLGILADVTWPLRALDETTRVRVGATGGVFNNSIYRTSFFLGGTAEIESRVTEWLGLQAGSYAGGITGYGRDITPAVTAYAGASYPVTDQFEVGLRGYWLPTRTLTGSGSDAFIGAVTASMRF